MFFGIFVLNRASILSIFVLNRASFNFLDDKQPARMFYELNYSKIFCLKQGRKISDCCLKQGQGMRGRTAPPHPRIYRVPPNPRGKTINCIQNFWENNSEAFVISKGLKVPLAGRTDTNFVGPLRMYFYRSKSILDSLKVSTYLGGNLVGYP